MSDNNIDQQQIDVRQLINELGVEELCRTAEEYFGRIENWDYHLALPFTGIDETPEMLIHFAQLLQGLRPLPGMTVLDFGAGSCWTSRFLTQLGYQVIALDVSTTALKIGQELFHRHPIFGNHAESVFLHFDGHRIDLPDESVDRISCLNSFHHVPNQDEILSEMARVLKQGGIAGFSEPGPEHSKSAQSQYEMRTHRVVENDINVEQIWSAAQASGFTDIKLAVFNSMSFLLPLADFQNYLAAVEQPAPAIDNERKQENSSLLKRLLRFVGNRRPQDSTPAGLMPQQQAGAGAIYAEQTRAYIRDRRVFFLYKGELAAADSRQRLGLQAKLEVNLASTKVAEGTPFLAQIKVTNSGSTIWLPISAPKGPVQLGVHLLAPDGTLVNLDYSRHRLMQGEGRPIQPGEILQLETTVPSPAKGRHILAFDLVSEGITWFEMSGSQAVRVEVEVT
ncbi:MAG TPA: class I SAM-dependent methyltransferase [Pyrinomonadaceae bacterium]|jgi:ubiquinone/menaquinone biosynthesis C-methylase UbiE